MHDQPTISRRRLIKTLFCSSVAMELNLLLPRASAAPPAPTAKPVLDLLAIGDFGSADAHQKDVAKAMATYAASLGRTADGLLMLGDNFYGPMPGGVTSPRWDTGFSQPYPSSIFPNPCWAILGNHDYTDTAGNEKAQLAYAASLSRKTRWTMPGKYYRVDLPADNPQVTFLMIDTNWEPENAFRKPAHPIWLTPEEHAAQLAWLTRQLASPRAPFTVVVGHHPLYSDGAHGDDPQLTRTLGPLLQTHGVHLYLCGHDHDLQHLELEGLKTSFVISGGGGAGIRPGRTARPGAVMTSTHGFTHLSLADNRLHIRHIESSGRVFHAFSKGIHHDWKQEA